VLVITTLSLHFIRRRWQRGQASEIIEHVRRGIDVSLRRNAWLSKATISAALRARPDMSNTFDLHRTPHLKNSAATTNHQFCQAPTMQNSIVSKLSRPQPATAVQVVVLVRKVSKRGERHPRYCSKKSNCSPNDNEFPPAVAHSPSLDPQNPTIGM
jgi:hypothetical protein